MGTRIVIIGGGVTGLAAAGFLADAYDCTLLERESELGGYCRTIYQDGFVWDYAGHFVHFRHPWIADYIHARMDLSNLLNLNKISRIYFKGRYIDHPFQYNINQLPLSDFINCLRGMYRAERLSGSYSSFKDMLYRRYGRALSDLFLIPYNEKLFAIPAEVLDPDAMGRFFPHIDFGDLLDILAGKAQRSTYNTTFSYHRHGIKAYVDALASYVPPHVIRIDTACHRIDLERRFVHTDGAEVPYDRLIASPPLPSILRMAGLEHDPAVFSANKVLVFNLGFDRPSPRPDHWVYYPEDEWAFFRVGHYDNILGQDRMSLYVEIGLPQDAEVDREALLARTLDDLKRCGVVQNHRLISHATVILDPAYVHISQASNAAAREAISRLNTYDVYPLGRYGLWTYCSIEDNIVSAYELARSWGAGTVIRPTVDA